MEIRNVLTFLRVAELLSFTKAAEELGYSQSAVTIQIKQLEDELGVPLFERIGRQVSLTEPGKKFIDHANNIYQAVESALTFHMEEKTYRGTLRIGAAESVTSVYMPGLIKRLHEEMPQIETTVRIASSEDLLKMLDRNHVDIVYLMDKKIYYENYVAAVDRPQPIRLIAGLAYPLPAKRSLCLEDIEDKSIISTEKGVSYTAELQNYLISHGKHLRPFLEIGNTDIIIRLVEQNCGISFLPEFAVKDKIQSGALRAVDVEGFQAHVHLQLLYCKNKWVTPQMKKFIALANTAGTGEKHDT